MTLSSVVRHSSFVNLPSMSLERWKKCLRYDPTRWLLETNDPSILLGVQLDIANRPPDAPGVLDTRERVLYSDPVQKIFAAQNETGYWGEPESLAQPYYTATLWNLVFLAELGIPSTSRRARNACEFVLRNFQNPDGSIADLNPIESGYLLRAFGYFNYASDPRTLNYARALVPLLDTTESRIAALWGWCAFSADSFIADAVPQTLERVLNEFTPDDSSYTFPQFNPHDLLFFLRVLSQYDRVSDPRAAPLIETLVRDQNSHAQWPLGHTLPTLHHPPLEPVGEPSRWITLNALRVLIKVVLQPLPGV